MYKPGIDRKEAIRTEAYLLSEKAGHPPGMETAFWAQAETLVASRAAKSAPKRKAASKPPVVAKSPKGTAAAPKTTKTPAAKPAPAASIVAKAGRAAAKKKA